MNLEEMRNWINQELKSSKECNGHRLLDNKWKEGYRYGLLRVRDKLEEGE